MRRWKYDYFHIPLLILTFTACFLSSGGCSGDQSQKPRQVIHGIYQLPDSTYYINHYFVNPEVWSEMECAWADSGAINITVRAFRDSHKLERQVIVYATVANIQHGRDTILLGRDQNVTLTDKELQLLNETMAKYR